MVLHDAALMSESGQQHNNTGIVEDLIGYGPE